MKEKMNTLLLLGKDIVVVKIKKIFKRISKVVFEILFF